MLQTDIYSPFRHNIKDLSQNLEASQEARRMVPLTLAIDFDIYYRWNSWHESSRMAKVMLNDP